MSELNNIRRELIKELIEIRETKKQEIIIKKYDKTIKNTKSNINEIIIINDEDKYNIKNIFYTENEDLYKKYKHNKNIYYILPRVFNNKEYNNEYLVVNDTASLTKYYKNNSIHTGIYMNVYNTHTIDLLKKYNVKVISLSPELKGTDLEVFKAITGISYLEYGRLELMLLRKNIFNNIDKAVIIDRNNKLYNYYKKDNYYVLKTKKFIINNEFIKEFIRMKEE